jgi:hypothetical protein
MSEYLEKVNDVGEYLSWLGRHGHFALQYALVDAVEESENPVCTKPMIAALDCMSDEDLARSIAANRRIERDGDRVPDFESDLDWREYCETHYSHKESVSHPSMTDAERNGHHG